MSKEKSNDLNDLLNKINSTIGDAVLEKEIDNKIDDHLKPEDNTAQTLDSSPDELDDYLDNIIFENHSSSIIEPIEPTKKEEQKMTSKLNNSKKTAILGIVMVVFFVIGFISAIFQVVNWSTNLINKTALKEELSYYVFPAVIVDTPEFSNPNNLDDSVLILSAVWKLIIDEQDKTNYVQDEYSNIRVPQIDIEYYLRQLYGPDVAVEHKSVGDATFQIDYVPEEQCYVFQSSPQYLSYMPRVSKLTKQSDVYTMEVEYMLPNPLWHLEKDSKNAVADKTMIYKVKKLKEDGKYQLMSVSMSNSAQTPSSDIPSDSTPSDETSSQQPSETESSLQEQAS